MSARTQTSELFQRMNIFRNYDKLPPLLIVFLVAFFVLYVGIALSMGVLAVVGGTVVALFVIYFILWLYMNLP